MSDLIKKVCEIQTGLKAPKNQYNSFGEYRYRSCEDILEAVKPMLKDRDLVLTISDDVVQVGERYYVKATATITDGVNSISNSAFAREMLEKKKMDDSQITGATSSYARKYALNGLFCIDDTKDADALPPDEKLPPKDKGVEDLKNEIKSDKAKATKELNKKVAEYNKSDDGLEMRYKNMYKMITAMKQINQYKEEELMKKITALLNDLHEAKKQVAYDTLNKLVNEKMLKEEPDGIPADICEKGIKPVDYLNAG